MTQEPDKKENVVNLADARKRQKTVRSGASAGKAKGAAAKGNGGKFRKLLVYAQFLVFLALLAYLMQLCSGRH